MQGNQQACESKPHASEAVSLGFKRFILDETESLMKTPEADLYRVQLLTLMLNRFDDYAANGVQEEAACTYVLREFSDIRERMISEGFGEHETQKRSASAWPQLSEGETAAYISESNAAAHKRAIGVALCCACVAPLMLFAGVETMITGYMGDVSSLLGLCGMFASVAAGVYEIVTAKKPEDQKKIRKRRFSLSAGLRKKLTEMKELLEEKARKKRGRGIVLLVACVLPIFLGAALDELWHTWTNDAFTMIGVGGMFVMIGAGVYDLITAGAQKNAVSDLLKD